MRLVAECRADHDSEWDAMRSVAQKLGIGTDATSSVSHLGVS